MSFAIGVTKQNFILIYENAVQKKVSSNASNNAIKIGEILIANIQLLNGKDLL